MFFSKFLKFVLLPIVTSRMLQSGKLPVFNLLTGKKSAFSPRRGDSLHQFTWNLAGLRGTHQSTRPNFSMHPVGKTMRWIKKMIGTFFDGLDELYRMQSLSKIYNVHQLQVWKYGVCMIFFVCHTRRPACCSFERDIVWIGSVSQLMGWFWFFFTFFSEVITLSESLDSSFVTRWRHNFRKIAVKKLQKVQKSAEKFVRRTSYR